MAKNKNRAKWKCPQCKRGFSIVVPSKALAERRGRDFCPHCNPPMEES